MRKKAYLTIDDGPSESFTALVDFLHARGVPAVFFNRGDNMEARPDDVIYGIRKGYVMANHTYAHKRASTMPLDEVCDEIARTENVLDRLYMEAGVQRTGRYFRFPYMDRGMAACLSEPQGLSADHKAEQAYLVGAGLGHIPADPSPELIAHKRALQDYLRASGFSQLPVQNVTIPWYAQTEMAQAIDSLCTFSTSDWALNDRHVGKHGFSTVDDLKAQIDSDKWLRDETSHHIILVHDQADIHDVTTKLVDYFLETGFEFLDFA
jgi:peptidoglycan/xylan/chitin deacetylase (PgdA/CDA1 family)